MSELLMELREERGGSLWSVRLAARAEEKPVHPNVLTAVQGLPSPNQVKPWTPLAIAKQ